MESSIDVAPMARWNGIDITKEVLPSEVAKHIKLGWVILMSYQRRIDVPMQEHVNGYVVCNMRSEYNPVVLMGQTNLDSLREQLEGLKLLNEDLRVKETKLHELEKEHIIVVNRLHNAANGETRAIHELENCHEELSTLRKAKYTMEADIGRIRSALGEIRMKEILGHD